MNKFFQSLNCFQDVENYDVMLKNIGDTKKAILKSRQSFKRAQKTNELPTVLEEAETFWRWYDASWRRCRIVFFNVILWSFVFSAVFNYFWGAPGASDMPIVMGAAWYLYIKQSFVTRATVSELERIKRLQGID